MKQPNIRGIALIDGEHYPQVVEAALQELSDSVRLVGLVFLGGTEKLSAGVPEEMFGLPVLSGGHPRQLLAQALDEHRPTEVVDLSDEPVIGYRERFLMANLALAKGARYRGADFLFAPPDRSPVAAKPSVGVIGLGKRIGKTAVAAYTARVLKDAGFLPIIVAMGRGGPPEPELMPGAETEITPEYLLGLVAQGKHAASDYVEDALMSRITTVGCRRCGGGLAGEPFVSNVHQGAEFANRLAGDIIIFEGSGSALPPVHTDVAVATVAASQPLDYISDYFGPYRLLISDLAVITNCEEPSASPEKIAAVRAAIRSVRPDLPVVETVFRPKPLQALEGERVFLATTAPESVRGVLAEHLQSEYGCAVVATSSDLSRRPALQEALDRSKGKFTVLATELKAAAVDVATRTATDLGVRVVYLDNVPMTTGGDGSLDEHLLALGRKAADEFAATGVTTQRDGGR